MGKSYLPDGQGAVFKNIIRFAGGTPLDGRAVVDTFSDIEGDKYKVLFTHEGVASYYEGMLVVTKDTGKVYVLTTEGVFKEVTPDLNKVLGSKSVDTYAEAHALATSTNIGQIIYVKNDSSFDADGEEGEGAAIEYKKAPYIVTGSGQLQKLAASTASGNIENDVDALEKRVENLETTRVTSTDFNSYKSEVTGRLDAKAGLDDFNAHKNNENIHVTSEDKVKWNNAEVNANAYTNEREAEIDKKWSAADVTLKDNLEKYADQSELDAISSAKVYTDNVVGKYTDGETTASGLRKEIEDKVVELKDDATSKANTAETNAKAYTAEVVGNYAEGETAASGLRKEIAERVAAVENAAKSYSIVTVTGEELTALGTNVKEAYKLIDEDSVKTGEYIKIYKDSSLEKVELVDQELKFTYVYANGNTETVGVDVSKFLAESEFSNGLQVVDHVVSVKVDETSEDFLSVSESGIKLSGVQEAISAAQSAAEANAEATATQLASTAQSNAEANAEAKATTLASTAQSNAEQNAKTYADGLNTAMDARVLALESIDHEHSNKEVLDGITADKVTAWDSAEQNAKKYADDYFVTKEGFNEFEDAYEEKLQNIEELAQVNVIEKVTVNGIEATITNKEAEVKVEADDIELGTAITTDGTELKDDNSNLKYAANNKLSTVLQSIYSSIRAADAGGVKSITSADASVEVNSNDINNPTVRVKVSAEENNLLSVKDDGLFVAMYYDGDDVE